MYQSRIGVEHYFSFIDCEVFFFLFVWTINFRRADSAELISIAGVERFFFKLVFSVVYRRLVFSYSVEKLNSIAVKRGLNFFLSLFHFRTLSVLKWILV